MMAASPSGDLYATQAQVQRLEDLVTKQQATLENIDKQKTLFQQDLNIIVQQVIEEATSQRGIRGVEYANLTKFITKQLVSVISQIQDANTKTLQMSIPLKKLQELEKRLLVKPTATEDARVLAVRLSEVETRLANGSFVHQLQDTNSKVEDLVASNTELTTMKEHIQHLETVLLQEVQRAYKTVYKPGEYGAPLTKLQSQVDILQQDIQRMKSVDSQTMAEALITGAAATIRHDFQDHMATRASQEDLNKFQSDLRRIEDFSREVQTGVYAVRTQCTTAIDQMNSKFTESRWLFLQERLTTSVKEELTKQSKQTAADFEFQRRDSQKVLDSAEKTVTTLNSEVRSQYGPEMLQRYLTEIQQTLQKQQTNFQTNLETSLSNSLELMRKEIQVIKSYSADFTTKVQSELTGSKLLETFATFENRLEGYQTKFGTWSEKFADAEETNKTFFETLYQQKVALRTEIQDAQTTLETLKTNQKTNLQSWYQQRKEELQHYIDSVGADADTLRAEIVYLKDEVRKELEQKRDQERYKEYQKSTDTKIDLWTAQKEDYLYSRMVVVQGEVRNALKKVDAREAEFTALFSEDTVREFVQECETRLKAYQEGWNRRRMEEYAMRYGELYREVQHISDTMNTRDRQLEELFSEARLQELVREGETRLKRIQDSWMERKNEELQTLSIRTHDELTKGIQDIALREENFTSLFNEATWNTLIQAYSDKLKHQYDEWVRIRSTEFYNKYNDINLKVKDVYQVLTTVKKEQETMLTIFTENFLNTYVESANKKLTKLLNETIIDDYFKRYETIILKENKNQINALEREFKQKATEFIKRVNEVETSMQTLYNEHTFKKIAEDYTTKLRTLQYEWYHKSNADITNRMTDLQQTIQKTVENITQYNTTLGLQIDTREKEVNALMERQDREFKTIYNKDKHIKYIEDKLVKFEEDCETRLQTSATKSTQVQRDEFTKRYGELYSHIRRATDTVKGIETSGTKLREDISTQLQTTTVEMETLKNEITQLHEKLDRYQLNGTSLVHKSRIQDLRYAGLTKCFYTALFGKEGRVDTLPPIEKKISGWDYICFTNVVLDPVEGWSIIKVPLQKDASPMLQAKYYKWMSHKHLEDYDVVVWIDAYISPNMSYRELLKQWILSMMDTKTYMVHRPHDVRTCVYVECDAVVEQKRDTKDHVDFFRTRLKKQNVPKNTNMFDTNIIIRFHKNEEVQAISEAIVEQLFIEGSTYRDQLVIPYVYHMKDFKGFKKENLLRAFDKLGNHMRNSV